MVIMNGWKMNFGEFHGSTYAYNQLKEIFAGEFDQELKRDERGSLNIIIENEEKTTEADIKNMFYFIKGYCMAHKNITFYASHLFK
jgi:hypothetical protein